MNNLLKKFLKKTIPQLIINYHSWKNNNIYSGYVETTLDFGFKFIGPSIMQLGNFEPAETRLITTELAGCDLFVDVGANVGYYTCIAMNLGKKTIAIEPLTENLNILFKNIAINNWSDIEVFPLGLAEKPGLSELYGASTGASLLSGWAGNSDIWKRTIALSTLDIILGDRFRNSQVFIKVDIEGAEYKVMLGADSILKMTPSPVWLIEICFSENLPNGVNPHYYEIFDLFWEHGYTAYSVEANMRIVSKEDVKRWLTNNKRDFGYVSFVFRKLT